QRVQREVTTGLAAHVEVLVEPAVRRREEAPLMPGDNDLLGRLMRPEDRIPLAAGDHDRAPRTVSMAFLIGTSVEDGHVAGGLGVGELDADDVPAGAASPEGLELVPGTHVREEVAVPHH